MIVYLDTSGLNLLHDEYDSNRIKLLQLKGYKFFISSVTIWEVLLNSDESRADELIWWAQKYCEPKLLKSASEILIDFFKLDCPQKTRKIFWNNPYTSLPLGKTWESIHGDISKKLGIELDQLNEFTQQNRVLSKKLKRIVNDLSHDEYENKYSDYIFNTATRIGKHFRIDFSNLENKRRIIISVILVQFLFCIGLELNKSLIREFWKNLKIDDPLIRLEFIQNNKPMMFVRGPIAEMSVMVSTQLNMKNSKSRGLVHDCFHSIYCYYSELFISNDQHFAELRDSIMHSSFDRILVGKEFSNHIELL